VVRPNGTKLMALPLKNIAFGIFPIVGLQAAREKRHDAEKPHSQCQDPAIDREAERQENKRQNTSFTRLARNG